MRTLLTTALVCLATVSLLRAQAPPSAAAPDWHMNTTIIEACSCPMFCQCYFNDKPAAPGGHGGHEETVGEHFCRFNNAYRVNRGHHGNVKLDGARFWLAGDLGGDFSHGQMDWAVLTFDPAVTPEQRQAITPIVQKLMGVKWKSFTVGPDAPIHWEATKDRAVAKLDNGKAGEVVLRRFPGMTDDPIVIHNLRYWGAPRNDGFIMMPNEVQAYRRGDKPYEFKGTNGFMITFDISSKDVQMADPAK